MNKQQIGEFVKNQREKKGLLQRQLADLAQVRRQTVMDIENAANGYAVDKLVQVLTALGYSISFVEAVAYVFKGVSSKIKT